MENAPMDIPSNNSHGTNGKDRQRHPSSYELYQISGDIQDIKADIREETHYLERRIDRLSDELRGMIDKRVTLDRFRPVELLAFGGISLTFGALAAAIVSLLR
jgi:hypothetical protein